jgi:5-methyltetrahydrofolate--homocysteine methyltransferase
MILIGELLNTSRRSVAAAVERRDADTIAAIARRQADAGADYIDVNAGTFAARESECLCWLVETVQAAVDRPLCIDSPSPDAMRVALERHRGTALVNSISMEPQRWQGMIEVVAERPCRVIALCMTSAAMPTGADERIAAGTTIVAELERAGVVRERILLDPLLQPVSIDVRQGRGFLEALRRLKTALPEVETVCGLSNVSFGLPRRSLVNRTFLSLALDAGLDAAICDPTDRRLLAVLRAGEMLLGRDAYCEAFIDAHQSGALDEN